MIIIFTDGSARGNPGPGGWGAIVAYEDKVVELGGREEFTTNNKMELMACIKALESLSLDSTSTLYSDSTYVVKGMTEWRYGWETNGWKNASKKPVENQDLWKRLIQAATGKHIAWRVIAGHAGIAANERCDVIATSYADNEPVSLYDGDRKGYPTGFEI
ncbi:MAG: ribonuclease [Parcubacteria group bacterium]|nr:ribonuclease [Parcubacteria group bacterium]